jgi:hypothetical protein
MFVKLREEGLFKAEAFVTWLESKERRIDRTLISHWMSGRTHLPADILVHLAEFTGRPRLVFGEYLRDIKCEVVHLKAALIEDKDIVDLMLEAGVSLGRLQRALIQTLAPDSPGGRDITSEECRDLRVRLDEFISQLTGFRAELKKREEKRHSS